MIGFPKILHQLHLFEEDGVPYVADLDKARVVELSTVMMDILKLAETQTDDAIVETLSASYKEDEISGAFERFAELEREGLLFNRGEDLERSLATESKWRKLLVAIPGINVDSFFDIEMFVRRHEHGTCSHDSASHQICRSPFHRLPK